MLRFWSQKTISPPGGGLIKTNLGDFKGEGKALHQVYLFLYQLFEDIPALQQLQSPSELRIILSNVVNALG